MSILVIKLGALGDAVQAMGALADIRAHHAESRLTVLTGTPLVKLFARHPDVDAVIGDPRRPRWRLDALWRLRAALRTAAPSRVYDLQNSGRTAFYRRLLLPGAVWSAVCGQLPAPHSNESGVPALDRLAAQLTAAGVPIRQTLRPRLDWMAAPVDGLLAMAGLAPPFTVLLPGSSARGAAKRWPHYAALAQALAERGERVATVPGPGEQALCAALPATMLLRPDGGVLDLFELAGVLARAATVVANDSGPAHIAAHLGCSGLVLFGPHTTPARTSIETARFRALVSADLASLSVADVLAALPPT